MKIKNNKRFPGGIILSLEDLIIYWGVVENDNSK